MRNDDLRDWLLLQSIEGLGGRTYTKLIERFSSPQAAMRATKEQLLAIPRFPKPGEQTAGNAELIQQGAIPIRTIKELDRILDAIAQ